MNKTLRDIQPKDFAARVASSYAPGEHVVDVRTLQETLGMTDFELSVVGMCMKRYGGARAGRTRMGLRWRFLVGEQEPMAEWLPAQAGHYGVLNGRTIMVADAFRDEEGRYWVQVGEAKGENRIF